MYGLEEVNVCLATVILVRIPFDELSLFNSCQREADTKAASPAMLSSKVRRAAVGWGSTSRRRLFLRCSDWCSYESMAVMRVRVSSLPEQRNALGF